MTSTKPAGTVRDINLTKKGARKVAMFETARARFQAAAQQLADSSGDVVRYRAPDGTVLVEATPAPAPAQLLEAKAPTAACQTCETFGQACCKVHQFRYRADCKLLCGTHPAFTGVVR